MIITRTSALMLHLQNPPIRYHQFFFSHFTHSLLCNPTSVSSPFINPKPRSFFSSQTRAFGSAVVAASASPEEGSKGARDTFFAEESVLWSSLGLSDTLSHALSNIGLHRPSLVQVPPFSYVKNSILFPCCVYAYDIKKRKTIIRTHF